MNENVLLVFDFETAGALSHGPHGLDAGKVHPIQIACVALHPRKLTVIPGSEFESMMRPPAGAKLNPKALEVNKKTPEQVWAAPETPVVWERFAAHVRKFNPKGASPFSAPIPCGKNIRNFDLPIVQWLCEQHGPTDKAGRQSLFHNRIQLDLEDFLWTWFENSEDLANYAMDTVRPFFGLSNENSHDALVDVKQTALLVRLFLQLHRNLHPKVQFRKAAAGLELS